jgi:hypothetical protein
MRLATIVVAVWWMLAPGALRLASGAEFAQTSPAPPPAQPSATPAPASPPVSVPKPCPAVSSSEAAPQADCKPASKTKNRKGTQTSAATPASGPSKKVVRDGSTSDPTVAISPGVSPQQASQQRDKTTWLLGKTDENLKTLATRQLNPAQQDTVDQVKRYVEESEAATKNGDIQRAYTLANKARILSRDLVKR